MALLLLPCLDLKSLSDHNFALSGRPGWVSFAIAAYALGHILFGLGAMVFDPFL
jgi:hypothetical protein